MNKLHKLKNFYLTELIPELEKIENERQMIWIQLVVLVCAGSLFFPTTAYFLIEQVNDPSYLFYFVPFFLLLAIGFYMIFWSIIKNSSFYRNYKSKIIHKLLSYINPSLNYEARSYISKFEFLNSQFFAKEAIIAQGSDLISGTLNGIKICFSAFKATYKSSQKRALSKPKYQFRGILFVAEFKRPFTADFVIEPKHQAQTPQPELVFETNNAFFNTYFQIRLLAAEYRDNAKRMITEALMEQILYFKLSIHNDTYISFRYNKMYVGIVHDKDLFEPQLTSSVLQFDYIRLHFNDLLYPIKIIPQLSALGCCQDNQNAGLKKIKKKGSAP